MRTAVAALLCIATSALPGSAFARGGAYEIEGGSAANHVQVRAALDASAFDWSAVPATVTVHLVPGTRPLSTPGHIWLDPALLDAGIFSWAVVQDEYAHQVDFFLLGDDARVLLTTLLRADVWCHADRPGLPHAAYGCERFTSTLVWSYWPVSANAYRPRGRNDESAAMEPGRFRVLLSRLLSPSDGALVPSVARLN